jgi:transposase
VLLELLKIITGSYQENVGRSDTMKKLGLPSIRVKLLGEGNLKRKETQMKAYYIGVDLHKRFSQVAVMDGEGELYDNRRLPNDREVLRSYFSRIPPGTDVAVESTSNWYWLAELFEEVGMEMHLSHPLKTRLIASSRVKTDKIDAVCLAHLLRTNFLPTCYIPDRDQRELKDLVRYRIFLVRMRTKLKNSIQNVLSARNVKVPLLSDLFGKRGRKFLCEVKLDQMDRLRVDGCLKVLDVIEEEIKVLNKMIRELASEDEDALLLMSIPGISYFSALTILSEIGDINRFAKAKHLVSYAGLNPSVRESGGKVRSGRISRQGSRILRWIMVECAQVAVRRSPSLKYFHQRIRSKKGYNIATVATARKILEVVFHVLKDHEPFNEDLVNIRYQPARVSPVMKLAQG